ncbi:DMT family transporter [Ponticoccus sp. SC2-23]|nr:DMT family transporter [Alexandriicola marinus]MBM1222021.1 DMT family transporter [Ponticoccus sp. SC6-9]MBM1226372.1 DMT family transporter [Ponticoccus sp. SC6-15]MBM1230968.1 DMT family transporter [Ponticoccus sp. SC6-38]MBM1235191.1 DMT family transporter [Ponticoccus sp. SC6-45]MBM1239990.1 DMT family transporter [Ponticoccus sp. SC6-49]MBM1244134.1 DMT family transporter [Ponticoccus sp. SC2-64]MBM1248715.1 DMT family transporter [Ponticoccus sp. SC6-42]MBM1253645.1 DMT family tr
MAVISDNTRGATLMAVSMTAYTANDAFLKVLEGELPIFQTLFLRGIGTVLGLLLLARLMGQLRFNLSRRSWTLIAIRTLAEAMAAYFFLSALFNMDLANLSAILQSLPLTVTLAGALFLGEAVGWRRMVAILVGLCGVMLIVKPGTEGFTIYSLYALGAVACVTVRDLTARRMTADVPTLLVSATAAMGVTFFAGIGAAVTDWAPVTPRAIMLIGGATVFIMIGYVCSVAAMRAGEIGFVAPFRYTSLIVALILGYVVFGTFPDVLTLIGAAIVVATGLFTIWRELKLRRTARSAA